jgi:nitroimidazol reductase NimA-like FMN-containing flavoprotein (pyridoxamine 5'-phosphate oxidase superfamily)
VPTVPSDTPFDVDAFLAEGLTARLATDGPTVRPIWYQWEDGGFWLMSGPWTKLFTRVQRDPEVAMVIDVCETDRGRIWSVQVHGAVEVVPYDVPRGRRLLRRYLGDDESAWPSEPDDYRAYLIEPGPEGLQWLRLEPRRWIVNDFSFTPHA